MSLSFDGIHIGARPRQPADSFRFRLRRQRRDRIRRFLLHESTIFWGMCALAAAITTFVCWRIG